MSTVGDESSESFNSEEHRSAPNPTSGGSVSLEGGRVVSSVRSVTGWGFIAVLSVVAINGFLASMWLALVAGLGLFNSTWHPVLIVSLAVSSVGALIVALLSIWGVLKIRKHLRPTPPADRTGTSL